MLQSNEELKVSIPLIAALSSVIGAIIGSSITSFVNYYLTEKNKVLAMRQTAVQELARIEGLFHQYPELYKYFHEDKCIGENDDKTRIQATAISHNYLKIFAVLILHQRENQEMFDKWVDNTIRKRYSTSPILRETLIAHIEEYQITGEKQVKLMLEGVPLEKERILGKLRNRHSKLMESEHFKDFFKNSEKEPNWLLRFYIKERNCLSDFFKNSEEGTDWLSELEKKNQN